MGDTNAIGSGKMPMVAVMLFGAFIATLNATLLSPALPVIMAEFEVNAITVQWLTSGYVMVEAVVVPLSAYLLGRFSTRKLFFFAMGFFALCSLLGAAAPNFTVLLAARAMQAVGAGVMMPMTITLMVLLFPREKRGSVMGLVTLIIGIGPAIGPTLGGVVADILGWRFLFVILAVLAIIVFVLGLKFVKNYEGFEEYPLDVPSVALLFFGMIVMLYGISTITSSATVIVPIVEIVIGLALLAVFVKRQLKLDQPMLKVTVLKSRKFRTEVIAIMVLQCAMIGGSVILPLYIQNVLGYSATVSGLVMLPGTAIGAVVSFLAGKFFDRHGVRGLTVTGVLIFVVAGLGTTFYSMATPILLVCLVYTFFILATQMLMTPLNTWGVNSLDNSVVQHANSLSNAFNQIAGAVGTALLTALTALGAFFAPNASALEQTYMGEHVAFIGLALLAIICAVIVLFFVRDKASDTVPERAQKQEAEGLATEFVGASEMGRSWTVAEAMDQNPKFVHANQKVEDVFDLFVATETDGVPVLDENDKVVGYLSDGDVLGYLAEQDLEFNGMALNLYRFVDDGRIQDNIGDLMELDAMTLATKKVVTFDAEMSLEKACAVFTDRKLKKAPVVRDGKLVGSLSRRNVVRFIAAQMQHLPAEQA